MKLFISDLDGECDFYISNFLNEISLTSTSVLR